MEDDHYQKLILALKLGVSGNSIEIKQSEIFIEESKSKHLYLSTLLNIIACDDTNIANVVKVNSAVQVKNFVDAYWKFSSNLDEIKNHITSDDDKVIIISNEEKLNTMSRIIEITGNCTDKPTMKLLSEAIRKIFKFQFNNEWKDQAMSSIFSLFESNNESKIYSGLFEKLEPTR